MNQSTNRTRQLIESPIFFVRYMWNLEVEKDNDKFRSGKHISWQQEKVLLKFGEMLDGKVKKRMSISSGRGIGKSCLMAWCLLFFLFTRKKSKVRATAPSREQIHDVLWAECKKWIDKMPDWAKKQFEWTTGHIRMVDAPEYWFASARTAKKESPEALAGTHEENVLYIADESSGIPDEVFRTTENSMTDRNSFMILASNPVRLDGFFYDSHHGDKHHWNTFQFSSLDSPIVDRDHCRRMLDKHGEDGDQYIIDILGKFPKVDSIDKDGYVPLFMHEQVVQTISHEMTDDKILSVDPAGEGQDEAVWVVRDPFKAKIVHREKISTPKSIASKTLTLMGHYNIDASQVVMDTFGVGSEAAIELAAGGNRIISCNVGVFPENRQLFENLRAEAFWKMREWLISGGELVRDDGWKELFSMKYKRTLANKIKMITKDELRRRGVHSPNNADSLMLSFAIDFIKENDVSEMELKYLNSKAPDNTEFF